MARVLVLDGDTRQALPVMRALREGGHHVTAACESRISMGWLSRYPHRRVRVPSPGSEPAAFIDAVERLVSTGDFDVAVPLFDLCAHLVSEHKDRLEPHAKIPLVDLPVFMLARDKAETMRVCQEHGLACPRTWFPEHQPIDQIAAEAAYPVLVKPRIAHGAAGIERADEPGALAGMLARIEAQHGPSIVQEFIPQTDLQYKAQFFRAPGGGLRAACVFSKLRYFPVGGGTSSLNQTVDRPDIIETGRLLLDAMDWVGYADLDLIHDPRDATAKVMEVNPRVTGSVKIAFEAGIDFADLLVRQALGQELPNYPDYRKGVTMRYLPLDVLWFLYSPDRWRADPSWFRFFGPELCWQVLSLRDPGPFLALGLGGIAKLLSPSVRAAKLKKG